MHASSPDELLDQNTQQLKYPTFQLPMEQCAPSELYPSSVYGTINRRPITSRQNRELEAYEPQSLTEYRRASPPVRVIADSSVYFNKSLLRGTTTGELYKRQFEMVRMEFITDIVFYFNNYIAARTDFVLSKVNSNN